MPRKKIKDIKNFSMKIPDSIVSFLILFISIQLQTMKYDRRALTIETVLMVLLAFSRLFRTLDHKPENKEEKVWARVNYFVVFFYLASAATISIVSSGMVRISTTTVSIAFALIAGRIHSIVRKHSIRNILMCAAEILVILPISLMVILAPFEESNVTHNMVMGLVFSIWAIIHIIIIFLSRLKLDVIKKIIRKTYATEILFWLLLLILAFSFVLKDVEEGIPTYQDALWYCFTLITTIGFGDFTAVTFIGRVLSVILGLYGIICVALITSIIVTFYGEFRDTD